MGCGKTEFDQLLLGRLEVHGDDEALDQLGHLGADHVGAEKLAGLLVEDRLDQPFRLAQRNRLAVADEGEAPDIDLEAGFLRPLLGKPDRGDLRIAIGAARDLQLVHRMRVLAGDRLDTDDALVLGLVRKHRRSGHVADRVDAGNVRPADLVDDDHALLDLHAKLLEPEILDIADHPDGGDHPLGGHLLLLAVLGLDGRGHRVLALLEGRHFGVGEDLDPLLLQPLAGMGSDLFVFDGEDLWQDLDDGHVGAERPVE